MIAGIGVGSHKPEFTHEESNKALLNKDVSTSKESEKDTFTYTQSIPHNQLSQKEAQ